MSDNEFEIRQYGASPGFSTAVSATSNGLSIPTSLAPAVTYTAWGAIKTLQEGCLNSGCTTVQETYDYNNRMQPVRIQLGTSSNNYADYCLVYNYYLPPVGNPTSCTATPTQSATDNGNVQGFWYEDNVNTGFSRTEAFSYDSVNRLLAAQATGNSTYNLSFNNYDQYGNMTCVLNGSTQGPCATYSFNAANNQVSGYTYDAAGNLINDTTYSYVWDAEGRLSQSYQAGTLAHQYTYNALNQRVEDIPETSPNLVQDFVYGAQGEMLGNIFSDPVNPSWWHVMVQNLGRLMVDADAWSGQGTAMLHYNALGTSIASTESTAGVMYQDTQYYPWGQFWQVDGGWPTGIFGGLYSMQCQFAPCPDQSQSRDYPPTLSRWMTPDPENAGADPSDPQTWNMYAYARNNPTSFIDPTGLSLAQLCTENNDCYNVDTDALTQAGFQISYDSNGVVTGASGPGTDVNFVDSNGNLLGTLGSDTNFTLTSVVDQQSVTVTPNTMSDATAALVMSPARAYGGPMAPSAQQALHAIANAAPTTCGGGVFGYAGAAGEYKGGEGFLGYLGEYDTKTGWSNNLLAEAGGKSASGGVAVNTQHFEPLLFAPVAGYGGLVGAAGGVGFYVGTPNYGAGAYLNVTTNAGCRGR